MKYEIQQFPNEKLPIKFHTDRIYAEGHEHHNHRNIKNNSLAEIPMRWHEGIEIWYIVSGNPTVIMDMVNFSVKAGDIVIVNTNQLHTIKVAEGECVFKVLKIEEVFCKSFGFELEQLFFKNVINDTDLTEIFNEITEEYYSAMPYYEPIVKGDCMKALGILSRKYKAEKKAETNSDLKRTGLVREITRYVSYHFHSQDILAELSAHLNYSKSYLTHFFPSVVGTSLKEYQMCIKFDNAKKMLALGRLSVFEVSTLCGYSTTSAFSMAFKKRVGITPAEYARKAKAKNKNG